MSTLELKQALTKLFDAQRKRALFLLEKEQDKYTAYLFDIAQETAIYQGIFSCEDNRQTLAEFEDANIWEQILHEFQYWYARYVDLLSHLDISDDELIINIQTRSQSTLN